MRRVFVDAAYYIALLAQNDRLHAAALDAASLLAGVPLVTSEPVLVELLAHVSRLEQEGFVAMLRGA